LEKKFRKPDGGDFMFQILGTASAKCLRKKLTDDEVAAVKLEVVRIGRVSVVNAREVMVNAGSYNLPDSNVRLAASLERAGFKIDRRRGVDMIRL
jgi:hypothetical protein